MHNLSHERKKSTRSLPKASEEINPKLLPLDELLKHISSKVLAYYFEQISLFLRKTKKDLWLPMISPYLDALLVRIVKDVVIIEYLMVHFDENVKKFALEIKDSLKANEKVYHLTYSYEDSKNDVNILVYKKIYYNMPDMPSDRSIEKTCQTKSVTNKSDRSDNKQRTPTIPTPPPSSRSFKTQWLTITLQFIKDSTKQRLEYPGMSYKEADYVCSLIQRHKLDEPDPLYKELWDTLQLFFLTHEIKNSFLYIADNRVQVSFEKTKVNNKKDEKSQVSFEKTQVNKKKDEKSPCNTSKSSESDTDFSKAQKLLSKKKQLIDTLDKSFINTALKMILDFICNEAEAGLVFRNANEDQCLFIQSACAMAKAKKLYYLFAEDSRVLLKNISDSLTADFPFDLKVDVAKMQKNDFLRTVALKKEPKVIVALKEPKVSLDNIRNQQSIDFRSAGKLELVKPGIIETVDNENKTPTNIIPKEPNEAEIKVCESKSIKEENKKDNSVKQRAPSVPRPTQDNNIKKIETIKVENKKDNAVEQRAPSVPRPTQDNNIKKIETIKVENKKDNAVEQRAPSFPRPTQDNNIEKIETIKVENKKHNAVKRAHSVPRPTQENNIKKIETIKVENKKDNAVEQRAPSVPRPTQDNNIKKIETIKVENKKDNAVEQRAPSVPRPTQDNNIKKIETIKVENKKDNAVEQRAPSVPRPTQDNNIKKIETIKVENKKDNAVEQRAPSVPRPTQDNNIEKIETIKVENKKHNAVKRAHSVPRPTQDNNIKKIETVVNGTIEKNDSTVSSSTDNNKVQNKQLFGRKAKLVEAMSIPLESEIAMRMMRQMGWQGGPLGIRGDGITEPLMPALHLSAGAGLGHIKPVKTASAAYVELLQEVLTLLKENVNQRFIVYNTQLSKKELQFVKKILKTFSNRRKIECNDTLEGAVDQILAALMDAPGVQLDCQLSNDRKTLILIKSLGQAITTVTSKETPLNNNNIDISTNNNIVVPEPVTVEWISQIGRLYIESSVHNAKAERNLGHRIGLLSKILMFFKEDSVECKMSFDYTLSKKQVMFTYDAAKRTDESGRCFSTAIEWHIMSEIRKLTNSMCLIARVINQQYIIMQKLFKPKDIVTSSKGPPHSIAHHNNSMVNVDQYKKESVAIVKNTDSQTIPTAQKKDTEVVKQYIMGVHKNVKDTLNDAVLEKIINDMRDEKREQNSINSKAVRVITDETVEDVEEAIRQSELKNMDNDNVSSASSKRSRSESEKSFMLINKKTKFDKTITCLKITVKDDEITLKKAKAFQRAISEQIDLVAELPLIECFGIQNGALVYGCYNEVGVLFIDSIAREMNLITTKTSEIKEKGRTAVKMKLNSYVQVNLKNFFNKIERYNEGLSTDLWSVTAVQMHLDFIIILVEIDDTSLEYISEAKFRLFAGIDKVLLSIDWK